MLFSEQGIALSGYRYNIGGGGVGVTDPARAPNQEPDDVAGRTFLRVAERRAGADPHRLRQQRAAAVHDERQVVRRRAEAGKRSRVRRRISTGIVTHTARPRPHHAELRQPDERTRRQLPATAGRRACRFRSRNGRASCRRSAPRSRRHAPYARVIADETTADAILADEAPQWLAVPGTTKYLAAIAHHTYDFPNDALRRLLPPVAKRFGLPTWMTEICCYKGSGGVATSFGCSVRPDDDARASGSPTRSTTISRSPATAPGTGGPRCRRCSVAIRRPIRRAPRV